MNDPQTIEYASVSRAETSELVVRTVPASDVAVDSKRVVERDASNEVQEFLAHHIASPADRKAISAECVSQSLRTLEVLYDWDTMWYFNVRRQKDPLTFGVRDLLHKAIEAKRKEENGDEYTPGGQITTRSQRWSVGLACVVIVVCIIGFWAWSANRAKG